MPPYSPSSECSDDSSVASPVSLDRDRKRTVEQTSPFLQLPNDIFKCITDYLNRDDAWSLKRLCHGMAKSEVVDALLYYYPIQLKEVKDIRLGDWKYRTMGQARWNSFKDSVNDSNRRYVQRLAMSHWSSIADFRWIEENLPALNSLDISAIKDFVWSPEETWTWKQLAEACPKLFAQLETLEVSNWADYTAHSRIEYSYSYNDYRFKQKFRMSRRRGKDGGSIARMIFPACKKLKTLAIRERYSGFHTWNEWEVHQRVCCLVDGVSYCPPTMTKLQVHDYAPYRSLFSTDASTWSNISDIEIGLYTWMEDRRDRDVIGPIPYRITQGHHHRDEEDAFDDKTFDACQRDHMVVGNHVVQGVGASFEDLLFSLRTITAKYPHANIRPIRHLQDISLHPFHLVNVNHRRGAHSQNINFQHYSDPVLNHEVQEALRWLAEKCGWRPTLAWDNMMCDVFPANLEPTRSFLPKADVLSRIRTMVSTLRSLNIPIRISIGDKANNCPSSGLDGSLYFGDYKTFVGEGENRHELLAPTQACFNLTPIADMIDELMIQYPVDVPGVHGWIRTSKGPTDAEKTLLGREMKGWRRFWERYARQFKNLKKLTANVPNDIYEDWGKCEALRELLSDERWEMLEVEEKGGDYGFYGNYFPFSSVRYNFSRKRPRTKFVQRVFFRQDAQPLNLKLSNPSLSAQEREDIQITDDVIVDKELGEHPFWSHKSERKGKAEKRKVENSVRADGQDKAENGGPPTKKRKTD